MKALGAGLLVAMWLVGAAAVEAQGPQELPESWLNQEPLKGWNNPGAPIPAPPDAGEPRADLLERCDLTVSIKTSAESAIAEAGWIPFRLFDREIVKGDVEIMGGMAGADGMCRPGPFNVFVYVGGRFAGTLSPSPMMSRLDASIGATRLVEDDGITAEFLRYASDDPLCCPSSRVVVRYRIERADGQPIVTPLDVRRKR